jgi:hypothetical protein
VVGTHVAAKCLLHQVGVLDQQRYRIVERLIVVRIEVELANDPDVHPRGGDLHHKQVPFAHIRMHSENLSNQLRNERICEQWGEGRGGSTLSDISTRALWPRPSHSTHCNFCKANVVGWCWVLLEGDRLLCLPPKDNSEHRDHFQTPRACKTHA